jgi:hypothetical protein
VLEGVKSRELYGWYGNDSIKYGSCSMEFVPWCGDITIPDNSGDTILNSQELSIVSPELWN